MATVYQSPDVSPGRPAPSADDTGTDMSVRGIVVLTLAVVINDILEVLKIPAGHIVKDLILETDRLDTNGAPLLTYDVGFMPGTPSVVDTARIPTADWFAASTLGQTGGIARPAAATAVLAKFMRQEAMDFERSIGVLIKAAPATGVAAQASMNVNRGMWQPATVYTANDYITLPDGRRLKCTTGGTSAAATTGQQFPPLLAFAVAGGTQTDGTVTWTMSDPYVSLTVTYRASRYGV